jgi:hypothetical protein
VAQPGRALLCAVDRTPTERGVHRSVEELETAINAFLDQHNANPKAFKWIKSAGDILAPSNGSAYTVGQWFIPRPTSEPGH